MTAPEYPDAIDELRDEEAAREAHGPQICERCPDAARKALAWPCGICLDAALAHPSELPAFTAALLRGEGCGLYRLADSGPLIMALPVDAARAHADGVAAMPARELRELAEAERDRRRSGSVGRLP